MPLKRIENMIDLSESFELLDKIREIDDGIISSKYNTPNNSDHRVSLIKND